MALTRFENIMRCFEINPVLKKEDPKYPKIDYILSVFNKFKAFYTPSSKLALDEIISPFKGRFKYNTYNKDKPTKSGIRIIALADSLTSFCVELVPCFGIETYKLFQARSLDELILRILVKNKIKDADIYMDNYFAHPDLARKLLDLNINLTGTVKANRRDIPTLIKNAEVIRITPEEEKKEFEMKKKPKKEGTNLKCFQSDQIFACKWRDKRELIMITTIHLLQMDMRLSARKRPKQRPIVVHEYNHFMRGVDKLNQRIYYIK